MRECEQVAAVCYRVRNNGIEFLLVQTRGGRWTFPKGGVEPGMTHAQSAALEAFEEAGVHGRMEEASFSRYVRRRRSDTRNSAVIELAVNAYLCEVLWLGPPQESKRNPTWFSAEKTKRRLQENRAPDDGAELGRVVDRALRRIQRLRDGTGTAADGLQEVQFEAFEEAGLHGRMAEASFFRHICREGGEIGHSAAIGLALNAYLFQVLRLGLPQEFNGNPNWFSAEKAKRRLLMDRTPNYGVKPAGVVGRAETLIQRLRSGTCSTAAGALQKVTAIDNARGTTGSAKASGTGRKNRRNSRSIDLNGELEREIDC